MKYKFIDSITSDVLFEAYGKNLKELFENSAEALASIQCKSELIIPKIPIEIELKAETVDELMIGWLQEIIARVDTEEMFFSKFDIKEISETKLTAEIWGEPITPEKGETVVKAVTYHKFKLEKIKEKLKATVSLDI
jgi:SHS2 domain-containing protein